MRNDASGMIICLGLVACLAVVVVDVATGTTNVVTASVVDRQYTPAASWTSVGWHYAPKGGSHPVFTSHHVAEQWTVIVRMPSETAAVKTTGTRWNAATPGAMVHVQSWHGGLFGGLHRRQIVD